MKLDIQIWCVVAFFVEDYIPLATQHVVLSRQSLRHGRVKHRTATGKPLPDCGFQQKPCGVCQFDGRSGGL